MFCVSPNFWYCFDKKWNRKKLCTFGNIEEITGESWERSLNLSWNYLSMFLFAKRIVVKGRIFNLHANSRVLRPLPVTELLALNFPKTNSKTTGQLATLETVGETCRAVVSPCQDLILTCCVMLFACWCIYGDSFGYFAVVAEVRGIGWDECSRD